MSDPFRVQIVDDDEVENYEKFYLSFSIPESASSCGAVAGRNTKMEFLIRDDDGAYVHMYIQYMKALCALNPPHVHTHALPTMQVYLSEWVSCT